jgi:hypothetical protein
VIDAVDDPDVRAVVLGGRQDPEVVDPEPLAVPRGRPVQVEALHDVALPAGLLVGRERVERLEDAELGAGDHGPRSV